MRWGEAILVFAGAVVGWYATQRWRLQGQNKSTGPSNDYLEGLNFLVNEQPDRAVEAFLRAVAVEPDTIETQFALGALFRRRGEVDRAIRLHQNLVNREHLEPGFREQATYALAQDYLKSGLYDRAEKLLLDLARGGPYRLAALKDLTLIYELEREWSKAIEIHEELARAGRPDQPSALAHYRCELADAARRAGDYTTAREQVKLARAKDRRFARAALVRADIALDEGDATLATELLLTVPIENPALAGEMLPRLVKALGVGGRDGDLAAVLATLARDGVEVSDAIAHAAIMAGSLEAPALLALVRDYCQREPAVKELISALSPDRIPDDASIKALAAALRRQALRVPRFRCGDCGFSSSAFFWQCPGCKSWDALKPLGPSASGGAAGAKA
jgi:lipopolysaccharide assembly protein B